MKIKKAIILGAGFGKRMYPITKKIPKPLVKIKNKTILENTVNFLISLGIKHIVINTLPIALLGLWFMPIMNLIVTAMISLEVFQMPPIPVSVH